MKFEMIAEKLELARKTRVVVDVFWQFPPVIE